MGDLHGDHDMGHTLAGWTGTAICLAGSAVSGAFLCAARPAGVALGAGMWRWVRWSPGCCTSRGGEAQWAPAPRAVGLEGEGPDDRAPGLPGMSAGRARRGRRREGKEPARTRAAPRGSVPSGRPDLVQ